MLVHRSTESLVIEILDIPATESPSLLNRKKERTLLNKLIQVPYAPRNATLSPG